MDAIIVALIAATPPTIMAILAWWQARRSVRAIAEVHLSLNSRLDELVKAEKSVSRTEGIKEGREELKN